MYSSNNSKSSLFPEPINLRDIEKPSVTWSRFLDTSFEDSNTKTYLTSDLIKQYNTWFKKQNNPLFKKSWAAKNARPDIVLYEIEDITFAKVKILFDDSNFFSRLTCYIYNDDSYNDECLLELVEISFHNVDQIRSINFYANKFDQNFNINIRFIQCQIKYVALLEKWIRDRRAPEANRYTSFTLSEQAEISQQLQAFISWPIVNSIMKKSPILAEPIEQALATIIDLWLTCDSFARMKFHNTAINLDQRLTYYYDAYYLNYFNIFKTLIKHSPIELYYKAKNKLFLSASRFSTRVSEYPYTYNSLGNEKIKIITNKENSFVRTIVDTFDIQIQLHAKKAVEQNIIELNAFDTSYDDYVEKENENEHINLDINLDTTIQHVCDQLTLIKTILSNTPNDIDALEALLTLAEYPHFHHMENMVVIQQQLLLKTQIDIISFVGSVSYLLFWFKERQKDKFNKEDRVRIFGILFKILQTLQTSPGIKSFTKLINEQTEALVLWKQKIVDIEELKSNAKPRNPERINFQTPYTMFSAPHNTVYGSPQDKYYDKNIAEEEEKNLAALKKEEPTFESMFALQNRL